MDPYTQLPPSGTPPTPQGPAQNTLPPPAVYQPGSGALPAPEGYGQPVAQPPTTPPTFSSDYLNQIAAPAPAPTHGKFAVIGLIGGVLLAALFALLLINGSRGPDFTTQAKQINARIGTLQTVASAQQKHLSENSIVEANATLSSTLTTMNTDLASLTTAKDKNTEKSLSATETNYQTTLSKTLDDAYQRGTLDRTYTVQMSYELTLLRGMMVKLQTNTSKASIKIFCETSIKNIDIILKLYADFDASKS